MPQVSNVSLSGNVDIDGVLSGYKWASAELSYSFPTFSSQYGYSISGFSPLISAQQVAVKAVFADYASVANFTFTQAAGTNVAGATLRFAQNSEVGTAEGYYPSTDPIGGDAWFNHTDYNSPSKGTYAFMTFIHEIGHTLGLDHGQDGIAALPANHDDVEYSVMEYLSYIGSTTGYYTIAQGSFPTSLMIADVAAMQYMYGANYSTNAGNTTYKWNPATGELSINGVAQGHSITNTVFQTIWDGGGKDTYDFSSYSTNLKVNLGAGAWTTTSTAELASLGDGHYARGNIANAYLYHGNTASLIDNAIGGSGSDCIVGNQIANSLSGNAGNDTLTGGLGDDTLKGGAGADHFHFSSALGSTNIDTICDFVHGTDKIDLAKAVFAALSGTTLASGAFYEAAGASHGHDSSDRIVYDTASGKLYYDQDGSGSHAAVEFAVLTAHPALTCTDLTAC